MMFAEEANPALAESQKRGITAFTDSLKQVTGIQGEPELQQLGLQLMAAVIYPVLLHKQLPDLYGIDYARQEEREAYIERLFRQYVPS